MGRLTVVRCNYFSITALRQRPPFPLHLYMHMFRESLRRSNGQTPKVKPAAMQYRLPEWYGWICGDRLTSSRN
ncbi:hypothetical protein RvY_06357 [Ramazzottius varieornatus]|uniref:Uncharacterized protein n=1 Tax=Ramazzottius varieornatus TaxID=947166 RepID=A0A1D1UYB2_RAMVA|nr:hypothetical protein RvY_06357 [Ramazzottius varieornatus]